MANANGGLIGVDNPVTQNQQAARISTFNSSGTFTAQPLTTQANVLVLAGGGGGGAVGIGGGGGAGGYRERNDQP